MKKIWELYNKNKEIINYLIVGILTVIINIVAYYFLSYTFLDVNNPIELQIANFISWLCAVIFAYITNRRLVFQTNDKKIIKEFSRFIVARVITLLFDMSFMFITVSILSLNDKAMKLLSNIVVIILNYILSKIFVFIRK